MIDNSKQRVRLLMVNSTLHIGGAERVAACLAQNLSRARFDVTACYLKENGVVGQEMTRNGVDLIPIPGYVRGRRDRLSSLKLLQLLRARNIQVMHTHDMHGFMDASVCRILMPRVRHVHTFHFGNYPHREARYKLIERALWRLPDALVAVGHAQAATIRDLYRIPKARMQILWNGVDAPVAEIAPEVRDVIQNEKRPIIASISTLIPQKGLHHLLDAAAILRKRGVPFVLLIAGDGHLRAPLKAQAAALELGDSVHFLGWMNEASRRLLPACDIFVQSSLWEAMSVVVLEAMSASKAMVVTSVGENPHVVEHDISGLRVAPGDPEALATSLALLLSDPSLRRRLGTAARERYANHFTVKDMITRHEALYSELACEQRT